MKEIERTVKELGLSWELWQGWKNLILEKASIIEIKHRLNIPLRDPHDVKFIKCAFWGGASYIVSGDKDLLGKERYQSVEIVNSRNFLKIL